MALFLAKVVNVFNECEIAIVEAESKEGVYDKLAIRFPHWTYVEVAGMDEFITITYPRIPEPIKHGKT